MLTNEKSPRSFLFFIPKREEYTSGSSIANGMKVDEIVQLLDELEFTYKLNVEMTGMSGASHRFDIVAQRGTDKVVIDLISIRVSILENYASGMEAEKQLGIEAIRMRAKSVDCGSNLPIIIRLSSALSGLDSHESDEFFHEFNVRLIETSDLRGAATKLRKLIDSFEITNSVCSE